MLGEMFHLAFANKFFLGRDFLQQMQRILKRFLRFRLLWFTKEKMYLESLLRIVQCHATSEPAVCFFTNAVGVNQIERNRFVEMPDVILPGKIEVVLIILRFNGLF